MIDAAVGFFGTTWIPSMMYGLRPDILHNLAVVSSTSSYAVALGQPFVSESHKLATWSHFPYTLRCFYLCVTLFLSVRSYICTFVRLCGFIWALALSFYVMFLLRNAMFYLFFFISFGVSCFAISGINARSKMLRLCHLG